MIYDCFPFFNELEILELRFMELYDTVDKFVIVEANRSHNGTPKEFLFEKNKDRYKDWLDKVIYIKVEDMPEYDPENVFKLEYFQRNAIARGLVNAREGDKILISDCDEIPNTDKLKENLHDDRRLVFNQTLFYYYVNNMVRRPWGGTVMTNYGTFRDPQEVRWFAIRRQTFRFGEQIISDGGWHYSYMTGGDAKRVRDKVSLFAEKHLLKEAGSVDDVANKMRNHLDLYNRGGGQGRYKQTIIDISNNKPKMLDKFLEKYPEFYYKENK